jgi:hypothetical protein
MRKALGSWFVLVLSVVAALSMWSRFGIVARVPGQFPEQKVVRELHGNHSDLYPPWYGSRALLLEGRDPYSADVTSDIQRGYWGERFNPAEMGMPKDEARFAYPLYLSLILAPTVVFPFEAVQVAFLMFLLLLTVLSGWFWKIVLGVRLGTVESATALFLFIGSWPASEAIHLQQLSGMVAALTAGALLAYVKEKYWITGMLLAIAMIKPQIALPLTVMISVHAAFRAERRKILLGSFGAVFAAFFMGSELLLPQWPVRWLQTTKAYAKYNESVSIPFEVLGDEAGFLLTILLSVATVFFCWRMRHSDLRSVGFSLSVALILAATVALSPFAHGYDQVLLLPGVVLLIHSVVAKNLSLGLRAVILAVLLAIACGWVFALLLLVAQIWIQSYVRIALFGMVSSMVITPLAVFSALLLLAYSQRRHWGLIAKSGEILPWRFEG